MVKHFWKRSRDRELEIELRRGRPAPPQELVDELIARVEAEPTRLPRHWRPRVALAGVVTTVMLLGFGAFGGLGYAKSAATQAVSSTTHAVTTVVKSPSKGDRGGRVQDVRGSRDHGDSGDRGEDGDRGRDDDQGSKPGHHQYHEHVIICHKGHTISVSSSAVRAHFRHGDTLGPCPPRPH